MFQTCPISSQAWKNNNVHKFMPLSPSPASFFNLLNNILFQVIYQREAWCHNLQTRQIYLV